MSDSFEDKRKDMILQGLAELLEHPRRRKITVPALASRTGVSKSLLCRYFPRKSHMFIALIAFIEKTLFMLINKAQEENRGALHVENLVLLLLGFSQKNPGMTRILIGDALVTEDEFLQSRMNQLHDRIESSLRQALRFAINENVIKVDFDIARQANTIMCYVIGRWFQFVRSEFKNYPLDNWEVQRQYVLPAAFVLNTE